MEHNEMVQKLHEKADISLEEAEDVLRRCNWDMLDALLTLEREGKIPPLTSSMSTDGQKRGYQAVRPTATGAESESKDSFARLKALLLSGIDNHLIVRREGRDFVRLPVLVALTITLCAFWMTIVLAFLGLIFGCTYTIEKDKKE